VRRRSRRPVPGQTDFDGSILVDADVTNTDFSESHLRSAIYIYNNLKGLDSATAKSKDRNLAIANRLPGTAVDATLVPNEKLSTRRS